MNIRRAADSMTVMAGISVPKPVKVKRPKRKRVNARKQAEQELEALVRTIVEWRDGGKCICAAVDGDRCNDVLQWGHYLARRMSSWMKLTLFTFQQCGAHNNLEYHGDKTMDRAIDALMGTAAPAWRTRLADEQLAHRGERPGADALRGRIEEYKLLWETRPTVYTRTMLVDGGFYG